MYGFEAASEFYFSKPAEKLTLTEAALLAGLPKSPSYYSPINHPDRAIKRRNLVINAMLEDGKITATQAEDARSAPLGLHLAHDPNSLAPYFVEEIRRYLENKYGTDQVHEGGLKVYTSLDVDLQKAANQAVLDGLAAYERRHGWKGIWKMLWPKEARSTNTRILTGKTTGGERIRPCARTSPGLDRDLEVRALCRGLRTGGRGVDEGQDTESVTPGDICYVKILSLNANGSARVSLEQDSGAQGALLAIDNATGGIKAMVGGRDFNESKFDRATQALRQVGSSFKPYVYTTVIDQGASPKTPSWMSRLLSNRFRPLLSA